jgi:hypothetical protein
MLNIEMQEPHSPEDYVNLIRSLFGLRRPIGTRGGQHLVISTLDKETDAEGNISGMLGRFIEIDFDLPWLDIKSLDEADETSTNEIFIPENLRPNFRSFYFKFFTSNHRIAFEQSSRNISISPKQVLKFFQKLVSDETIVSQFGSVSVSLIQDDQALNEILSLRELRWIRIEFRPPNPDDQASYEASMRDKLRAAHAKKLVMEMEADASGNIEPDSETLMLAEGALSHGRLDASGYSQQNEYVRLSSEEQPVLVKQKYDPDLTTEKQALQGAFSRIMRWTRSPR